MGLMLDDYGSTYRKTFLTKPVALKRQPALAKELSERPLEGFIQPDVWGHPRTQSADKTETPASMLQLAARARTLYEEVQGGTLDTSQVALKAHRLLEEILKNPLGKFLDRYGGPAGDFLEFADQMYEITFADAAHDYGDKKLALNNSGIKAFTGNVLVEDRFARKAARKFLERAQTAETQFDAAIAARRAAAPPGSALACVGARDRNLTVLDPTYSELKKELGIDLKAALFESAREVLPPDGRDDPAQVAAVAAKVALLFHDDFDGRIEWGIEARNNIAEATAYVQEMGEDLNVVRTLMPEGISILFSDWLEPVPAKLLALSRMAAEKAAHLFTRDDTWTTRDNGSPGKLNGGRVRLAQYHHNTQAAIGALVAGGKGAIFKRFAPTLAGRLAAEYKYKSAVGFRQMEASEVGTTVFDAVKKRLPDLYRRAHHGTLAPDALFTTPDPFDALSADKAFVAELVNACKGLSSGDRSGTPIDELVPELIQNERFILFNSALATTFQRDGFRQGLQLEDEVRDWLKTQPAT